MFETKFNMPQIGKDIIKRGKIEEKLRNLPYYKFAYLSAPAGYGKTTAVVDYITRQNMKCAWVSIDAEDNDPVRFWISIITAISRCAGKGDLQISLDTSLISSNISIDLLINVIKTISEEFVIVLDDYHLIHNNVILGSMEYFVKCMPPNVRLMVLSRKEPEEMLSLLLSKEKAISLNISDFEFDYEDTAEFFARKGLCFTEEEINDIYNFTEGWVAALVGAFLYFKDKETVLKSLTSVSAKGRYIHVIFKNEVFDCWPEEIKNFLIQTSFLNRISGSICSAVTGNEKSAEILETLAQNNSFIIALDAENEWFRYHHLFQEFLFGRFELLSQEQKNGLYCLAGEWYARHGMREEAVKWLLEAKEYEKAMPLILFFANWTVSEPSLSHDFLLWRKWVDKIPERYYCNNVTMYTYYSWIAFMNSEIDISIKWKNKAWDNFNRIKEGIEKTERDFIEAAILFNELNLDFLFGDISKVYQHFDRLREIKLITPVGIGEMNWYESSMLKTPYGFKGRLRYINAYNEVVNKLRNYMGDNAAYIVVIVAESFYEQNMLDESSKSIIAYMGSITDIKKPGLMVPAFILLAKIKMVKGDQKGAFSAIEEVKRFFNKIIGSVWNYHLDIFKAILFMQIGEFEQASEIINQSKIGLYDTLSCVRESEYIAFARLLIHNNHLEDAMILLNRLEHFARKEDRLASLIEILCLTAIGQSKKGDYKSALASLKQALSLGEKEGYVRSFVDELEPMAYLLNKYISANKSGGEYLSYAKELFRQTNEYVSIMTRAKQYSDSGAIKDDFPASLRNDKEIEILKLLAENKTNNEIVGKLFLSLNTVKQYNSRIFDKLGVKNRHEAVIKAIELKIIQ
jgi:LuxR family maltose regulon positive regulatory protein